MKPSTPSATKPRKRPISGPALVVLALVLAGIWYGGRSLSQTSTVAVDTAPSTVVAPATAPKSLAPAPTTPPTSPAPTAAPSTPALVAATPPDSGLPAGYPSSIPTPKNSTLTKATVTGKGTDQTFVASYQLSGQPAAVSQAYQDQLTNAGFAVHAVLGSADSTFFGAEKNSLSLSVSVGADQSTSGKSNLTITTSGN